MWTRFLAFVVLFQNVFGAPYIQHEQEQNGQIYPEDCTYRTYYEDNIELNCTSFKFFDKINQKEYYKIMSLTMNNSGLEKVDPKIKYLKKLKYLDLSNNNILLTSIPQLSKLKTLKLSGNNIKSINISSLPSNLKELDLSNNYLAQIPKDWTYLKSLKHLNLYKNPINCDCNNVKVYHDIIRNGIILESLVCHSPVEYQGKLITTIDCTSHLFDIMVDDEGVEGSGSVSSEEDTSNAEYVSILSEESETEAPEPNVVVTEVDFGHDDVTDDSFPTHEKIVEEESGSGEGSGELIEVPQESVTAGAACIIDCKKPQPLGENDDKNDQPLPGFSDQLDILTDDLDIFKEETKSTTTTTTTLAPEPEIRHNSIEPPVIKEQIPDLHVQHESEIIGDKNEIESGGETDKVSALPENQSNTLYTIIGICCVLAICILIFLLQKRKLNQNRMPPTEESDREMKLMNEKLLGKVSYDEPVKQQPTEHVPLMNGNKNGKINDNHNHCNEENYNFDEVPLRRKPNEELLTPQRERVTIKETELLDSIPKTPLFVHRQRNSNGEIVIVPSS